MGQPLHIDHTSLRCPFCGSPTLHHETVDVYFRQEDADHGIAVTVQGAAVGAMTKASEQVTGGMRDPDLIPVAVGTDQQQNPSPRRDGVAIRFWCEACPATPVLNVIQHKGDTIIEWGAVHG